MSIIIPVFNKIETTRACIASICDKNASTDYEIVIVDNGSTDETQEFFSGKDNPPSPPFKKKGWPEASFRNMTCRISTPLKKGDAGELLDYEKIIYIRNRDNLGVAKALNTGAAAAHFNVLCFMHNDVIVNKNNWTSSIKTFIDHHADAGVVGLYGAKTVRKDGSFRGKSIVHSKRDIPSMSKRFERVSVVDGLLMAMRKSVFNAVGGFTDEFIMHFYDKDISMKTMTNGFVNYVLNIPFQHFCAATRTLLREDDRIREKAKAKFLKVWSGLLPVDVTTWRERIASMIKRAGDQ